MRYVLEGSLQISGEAWRVINEGYETCFRVFRNSDGTAQGRDAYLFMTDTGIYPWSPIE